MAKWQPVAVVSKFRLESDKQNKLLEELAEIFYDYFCQSVKDPFLTAQSTESNNKEEEVFFERTGSDG